MSTWLQELNPWAKSKSAPRAEHTHVLCVMDHSGDTRVEWKTDVDESFAAQAEELIAQARALFEEKKKAGYLAYKTEGGDGGVATAIKTFDLTAERIVLVPPMAGG